jgi:hypothetical protein
MLRVEEGRYEEAWQDLLACHRLGRLVARGATLIEALVGIAVDQIASQADLVYLERAPLTSAQIRDRLKDLQGLPPIPPMADKMELGERFAFLGALQSIRRGGAGTLEAIDGQVSKPTPEEEKALDLIDWEAALRAGNRCYDLAAAAMRYQKRAEREKALDQIEKAIKALTTGGVGPTDLARLLRGKDSPGKLIGQKIGNVLLGLLFPAIRKVQSAHDRAEQVHRNLHVAIALAAYHRDHGRYPEKLDDVAPRYLATVPNDLFSGKTLVYRRSEKGYLFYSVGVNGVDEGGRWYDDDPPGDDPGVRMPLPALKMKR